MLFESSAESAAEVLVPFHQHLIDTLERHARDRPDQPVFIHAETERPVFAKQIIDDARALATYLRHGGFVKGDRIVLMIENGSEYVSTQLACSMLYGSWSGAVMGTPIFELEHRIRTVQPKVVFCMEQDLQLFLHCLKNHASIRTLIVIGNVSTRKHGDVVVLPISEVFSTTAEAIPELDVDLKTTCFSLPMSRYITENMCVHIDPKWNWRNEIMSAHMPLGHVFGQFVINFGMLTGATNVLAKRGDYDTVSKIVSKYKVQFLLVLPPILAHVAKTPGEARDRLDTVKVAITGGGPLSPEVAVKVKAALPNIKVVSQFYAMTETLASAFIVYDERLPLGTVGKIICDTTGQSLGPNEIGLIEVKTKTACLGYLNNPEQTKELFNTDGFIRTGDLGYFDDNGYLFLVGRSKEMIKCGGKQVPPAEVEGILLSDHRIKDCAVVGKPDDEYGQVPYGFVVRADGALTADDVHQIVNERVIFYKRLTGGVSFIDAIPRNNMGKIVRQKLVDQLTA